jgi:hypothetical protein
LKFAAEHEHWESLVVKAGFVIQKQISSPRDVMGWILGEKNTIRVHELAAIMIDKAISGWREKTNTLENCEEMGRRGREILGKD